MAVSATASNRAKYALARETIDLQDDSIRAIHERSREGRLPASFGICVTGIHRGVTEGIPDEGRRSRHAQGKDHY